MARSEWQERIGVGEPCNAFTTAKGKSPRRRPVTVEEGPHRGTVGGFHTDHPDGRVDATVHPQTVTTTLNQGEPS
jgi:hypothetical protein